MKPTKKPANNTFMANFSERERELIIENLRGRSLYLEDEKGSRVGMIINVVDGRIVIELMPGECLEALTPPFSMKASKPICRGCANTGKNLLNDDGFCGCPIGRELKVRNDAKVDRYLDGLGVHGMEYSIGTIVRMSEENGDFDWTIREKKWIDESAQFVYFLTRPGFEGWFSRSYIDFHTSK